MMIFPGRAQCFNVFLLVLLLSLTTRIVSAQGTNDWEKTFYELLEEEDLESSDYESSFDVMSDLAAHPLNINTATREDWERIPFLNATEIEDLCAYCYNHGGMRTVDELAMVGSISYDKRLLLMRFVYAGDEEKRSFPSLNDILARGKHEVLLTGKIPFYERAGDKDGYLGYQYKHNIRYDFKYGDYVRFGIVGAQDTGEPFFANRNKAGYDFYSFYFVVRKLGCLKTLVLGKYRAEFGLGLVVNNGFSLGKTYMLSSLGRTADTFRPHTSTQQGSYLQGAAVTLNAAKGLDVSAFVSYRGIDGTLTGDSTAIATIVTTGYHRTETEMAKKNNTHQTVIGGNARYSYRGFHLGLTAVYTSLSKDLRPDTAIIYRQKYASGNDFYNIGINYGYTYGRLSLSGETATGKCGAVATINSGSLRVGNTLQLTLLQRFYSLRYFSLFARSFSEGGSVQNESGIYGGLKWQPSRKIVLTAYTDYAYFPWPKYYTSSYSHSWDNLLSLMYKPGSWSFYARYRYKMRERDTSESPKMAYRREHKARLYAAYDNGKLSLKTQGDMAYTRHEDSSFGWMLTQSAGYIHSKRLRLYASVGYFNTDDYNSRVYNYERGMLYSYNNASYYGEGIRYSLLLRSDISKHLTLNCKISTTDYFDRNHISSGYQQIDHSSMTDMEVQLRLKI